LDFTVVYFLLVFPPISSIGYWWKSQKERDHCEDENVSGWTILKWILEKYGIVWISLMWLRIGTSGGLL
jgi:hypothetical protein